MLRSSGVLRVLGTFAACGALLVSGAGVALAEPTPRTAQIEKTTEVSPQRHDLIVSSPAMGGKVQISVLTPADLSYSRGTLYLLDGAGAEDKVSDWLTKGGAEDYFADKDVTVVLPSGKGAFYTDWQQRDAAVGKPQWETFLTRELPPLINSTFNGNGNNAIAGLSMGGQAAYALAARHPGLYTGAGSLSGCPPVTGLANEGYVRTTMAKDGGDATNMWGPFGSPGWAAHDPSKRLDALRGKNLYISAGSGLPGPLDQTTELDDGMSREQTIAAGAALEIGAYRCSVEFAVVMRAHGVGATENFHLIGTHAWPYWAEDLKAMYPVLARGL